MRKSRITEEMVDEMFRLRLELRMDIVDIALRV